MQDELQVKPIVPLGTFVVGTVVPYGGKVTAGPLEEQGWLFCNGDAISRTEYAGLFSVIGTLHGAGDHVKTFNLPDYRGIFMRGVDNGAGWDPDAATRTASLPGGLSGDVCGSRQEWATGLPHQPITLTTDGEHKHSVAHLPNSRNFYVVAGSYNSRWNEGTADTEPDGKHKHTFTGGGDAETRPVNINVNYLIKYRA